MAQSVVGMDIPATIARLQDAAAAADHRRGVVMLGDRDRAYTSLREAINATPLSFERTTVIGPTHQLPCERVAPDDAKTLLGQTRDIIVIDAHETLHPNTLGYTVGAIDGGGLFVLLAPEEQTARNDFDDRLAAPPYSHCSVTAHFRSRLLQVLHRHPGIAVADLTTDEWRTMGEHTAESELITHTTGSTGDVFPERAYTYCRTADQRRALTALETLTDASATVLLEADRGRGKSTVAGFAAAALAAGGERVYVTAPHKDHTDEFFAQARRLLGAIGEAPPEAGPLKTQAGGQIGYCDMTAHPDDEEAVLFVEEAAGLPVPQLERTLTADRVVYITTQHGYEGTGGGFPLRFAPELRARGATIVTLETPIRYAAGDPVEAALYDALLLAATPGAAEAVTPVESATYTQLTGTELLTTEAQLREVYGLLRVAHYRSDPTDLRRLLDAPNLATRALTVGDNVLAVALLAREGGLTRAQQDMLYTGGGIRGHLIPDLLTAHLREPTAGAQTGLRVLRIATHPAHRSRGVGSRLLSALAAEAQQGVPEFDDDVIDWLGVSFGVTPRLVHFWRTNDYRVVHTGTTRNPRSGAYSGVLLQPLTAAGHTLQERLSRRLLTRLPGVAISSLRDMNPQTLAAVVEAIDATVATPPSLDEWEQRTIADAAFGPGLIDVAPTPAARLLVSYLAADTDELTTQQKQIAIGRLLQGQSWEHLETTTNSPSTRVVKRTLGDALGTMALWHGGEQIHAAYDRFGSPTRD